MYYWHQRWYHNNFKRRLDPKVPTWEALQLGNRLKGYGWKIDFEKWDGHKHIDIAIVECKVDIEVDGHQHQDLKQALSDLERTFWSFKRGGYITLRVPNILVRNHYALDKTANIINAFLQESRSQLGQ